MNAGQRRRADKIMQLLVRTNPGDDGVVLINVFAAFMINCRHPAMSTETLLEGADELTGDVKDAIRKIMAVPSGLPQ